LLYCKVSETKAAVDALEKEVGFCLRGYVDGTSLVPRHLQIDVSSLAEYLTDTLGLTSEGTYRQTDRQTDRRLQIDIGSLAEYLTDTLGLTSEGTYRQTDTDRQTDRQTSTDRHQQPG